MIFCPSCDCEQIVKNGFIHNGKQNFLCKSCGRQFVLDRKKKVVEQETLILNRACLRTRYLREGVLGETN